jgi:hypothetical protein
MKYSNTTIKNPLTIIAIFSGISEISGTAILPFLEEKNQETFLWFLMLFPFFLVLLFFTTLNWNYKVLYAPSDFADENHFINLLGKASVNETYDKIKDELIETSNLDDEQNTEKTQDSKKSDEENIKPENNDDLKSQREKDNEIIKSITRKRMEESRLSELLILRKLENEFRLPIQKDMKINIGRNSLIFDGVIELNSYQYLCIDIKFMRTKNAFSYSMWENLKSKYSNLYSSFDYAQKRSFKMMFVAVTTDEIDVIKNLISRNFEGLPFPVETRVYNFDELNNEK